MKIVLDVIPEVVGKVALIVPLTGPFMMLCCHVSCLMLINDINERSA